MQFSSSETLAIRQWNGNLQHEVSVLLVTTKDERSNDFEAFVQALTRLAPRVLADTVRLDTEEPPAIYAGKSVRYHAIPSGRELIPFLKVAADVAGVETAVQQGLRVKLEAVLLPVDLQIYVTSECAFCPRTLEMFFPLALANPLICVTVIDGILFPEMAVQNNIRSVPTIILDGQFRWTGQPVLEEVLDAMLHRDLTRLSSKALMGFIKEGNADRLADMMIREKQIFPAFLDLLMHPEWSVRLGAMVVAEEIGDREANLALAMLKTVWERLKYAEDSVKGDAIYLFGVLGTKEWIPSLETLLREEEGDDVREVLKEAVERLRNQN